MHVKPYPEILHGFLTSYYNSSLKMQTLFCLYWFLLQVFLTYLESKFFKANFLFISYKLYELIIIVFN